MDRHVLLFINLCRYVSLKFPLTLNLGSGFIFSLCICYFIACRLLPLYTVQMGYALEVRNNTVI